MGLTESISFATTEAQYCPPHDETIDLADPRSFLPSIAQAHEFATRSPELASTDEGKFLLTYGASVAAILRPSLSDPNRLEYIHHLTAPCGGDPNNPHIGLDTVGAAIVQQMIDQGPVPGEPDVLYVEEKCRWEPTRGTMLPEHPTLLVF